MHFLMGFLFGFFVTAMIVVFVGMPLLRKTYFDNFNIFLCNFICEKVFSHIKNHGGIPDIKKFHELQEYNYRVSNQGYDDCIAFLSEINRCMDRSKKNRDLVSQAHEYCFMCKIAEGRDIYLQQLQDILIK
jgi:hypothetical protein